MVLQKLKRNVLEGTRDLALMYTLLRSNRINRKAEELKELEALRKDIQKALELSAKTRDNLHYLRNTRPKLFGKARNTLKQAYSCFIDALNDMIYWIIV